MEHLPDTKSVAEVWAAADRRHAAGDLRAVADLGIALADRYGPSADQLRQYDAAMDHLLRLLTLTPGRDHVAQAVRLVAAVSRNDRKAARYAASLLAHAQVPEDLAVVFSGAGEYAGTPEELRACLVHELLLRGLRIAQAPEIQRWATSPHWRHHPLAWLPLELSGVEETPPLPGYDLTWSDFEMPYKALDGPGLSRGSSARLPELTDTTTEAFREAVGTAVANWFDGSNGSSEVGTYELSEPVEAGSIPDLLMSLGLACLDGMAPHERPTLVPCGLGHAWDLLFAAASRGGAYSDGDYGAYGRLAAWRSLAALSGTPAAASFGEVERDAQGRDWYSFHAPTRWFERPPWRVALVSAAPGRRRLAVFTAMDTD